MKDNEIKSAKAINQELALHIAKECFDNHIGDSKNSTEQHIAGYAEFISKKYLEAYSKLKELISD